MILVDQLRFALGMTLEQRAAPAVRVHQAVAKAYGVPLERRMVRLLARMSGESTSTSLPPVADNSLPQAALRAPSAPPLRRPGEGSAATVVGRLVPKSPTHSRTSPGFPKANVPEVGEGTPAGPPVQVPPAAAPAPAPSVVASPVTPTRPSARPVEPRGGLLQREVSAPARTGRRRRGPLTADAAKAEAEEAADRDALLDLFFDFSQQFFDYSSLFLVHGDIAEGRDAFGAGASRERVLGIGVPLDMPSLLSTARDKRLPVITKVSADGLDAVLLADLQRPRDAEIAIVPLVVRTRPVAIFVGDCGDAGVDRAGMQQVVALSGFIGKAFERIIVRRKLDGFIAGSADAHAGRVSSEMVASKPGRSKRASSAPPSAPPAADKGGWITAEAVRKMAAAGTGAVPPAAKTDSAAPARPAEVLARPEPPATQPEVAAPKPQPAEPAAVDPFASWAPSASATPAVTVPSSPPVPFVPKRAPSRGQAPPLGLPPPAANVAVVRRIGGPPIPREEPELAGAPASSPAVHGSVRAASPKPAPSPRPPEVADVEVNQEIVEVDEDSVFQEVELPPQPAAKAAPEPDPNRALFDELGWGQEAGEVHETPQPISTAIAVAAHKPPAPVGPGEQLPSIIIEDLDRDLLVLVDRLASGEVDESAEGELLRQGERAMRAIMSRFPGPIAFNRSRIATANNPPRASECGPILRLIARERRVALPFVLERLSSADPEERGWATHLLGELPYVEAIPRLLSRLRDDDASTAAAAAHALAAVAKASPEPVGDALVHLSRAVEPEDRTAALRAMARLREAGFVPEFIRALGDENDAVVTAAHDGLVQVTRQDFGTDARHWVRWWEQHSSKHRIEWLIDALAHDVAEIRKSAAEELRAVTREYFGYAGDLPARDRDRAQQRYRDWWALDGRARFRRS